MYSAIAGRTVEDLFAIGGATVMRLSGGLILRFGKTRIDIGRDPWTVEGATAMPQCWKNIEMEPCTLDFIKTIAVGKAITSAGDFGDYIEFGLDQRFNLGLHRAGFHLVSTENPIERHRL
jgi:hypothetical protein